MRGARNAIAVMTLAALAACRESAPANEATMAATDPARAAPTEWGGVVDAPAELSWTGRIAPESEPGELLEIEGVVYKEDGVTPAKDVVLYLYHTNAAGLYPKTRPDDGTNRWRHGALRGFLRTGADGRYRFRTIRPAPYPGDTTPAHIHCTITAPEIPEYWIEDFNFEGDPFLSPQAEQGHDRGGFPNIVTLERDANGVFRGTRNIRLVRGL